jgi:hypothetical protein
MHASHLLLLEVVTTGDYRPCPTCGGKLPSRAGCESRSTVDCCYSQHSDWNSIRAVSQAVAQR